jgi:RHS repeat-associated protein
MVLDASTTKEESLDHNPLRSVPFSTTLCVPFRAVWRRKRGHEADGRGNVLAGGERGGKSHITYKPYGEILRTDSYGPDISKYKYTGQEEDRESGLMYYKARYYDAKIGRFLQHDSMAFPNQVQGMNRMMYVEGNPVGYRDPSGNNKLIDFMSAVVSTLNQPLSNELLVYATFATGKGKKTARDIALINVTLSFLSGSENYEFSNLGNTEQKNLFYLLARTDTGAKIGNAFRKIFRSIDHSLRKVTSSIDHIIKSINKGVSGAFRVMAKGADGGARWLVSGGKYSRNNANDLDYAFSTIGIDTNGFFDSFVRSDLGRAVTSINQSACGGLIIDTISLVTGFEKIKISKELITLGRSVKNSASLANNLNKCLSSSGNIGLTGSSSFSP